MALTLFELYDRKEVHDIFEPASHFIPSVGTWGLQGIVPIKKNPGDYVLFVTLGTTQGSHKFVEEVFDDGTFTWQSQPSNKLSHKYVVDFINHDNRVNSIYLFVRTSKTEKYVYLGTLEYVTHDNSRECPVYFMWRMIDFDIHEINRKLPRLAVKNRSTGAVITPVGSGAIPPITGKLTLHSEPNRKAMRRTGVNSSDFKGRKVDFQGEQAKNSKIGRAGEDAVVRMEKVRLTNEGRPDLATRVTATRHTIGDTAKFDVQSFEKDGTDRYIEVKTTTGAADNYIHISEAEVAFSENHSGQYYLYRLYNYNQTTGDADYFIRKGAIDRTKLVPTNYVF